MSDKNTPFRNRPSDKGIKWWRLRSISDAYRSWRGRTEDKTPGTPKKMQKRKYRWDRGHSLIQEKSRKVQANRRRSQITKDMRRQRAAKGQSRRDGS